MHFSTKTVDIRRHRYIDETITMTREILDDSAVKKSLGESSHNLSDTLEQLYVPNSVGNRLRVPYVYNHNKSLAITAIRDQEIFFMHGPINHLHQQQEDQFVTFLRAYTGGEELNVDQKRGALEQINGGLGRYQGGLTIQQGRILAKVSSVHIPLEFFAHNKKNKTKRVIRGRPFISFAMRPDIHPISRSLTLIHELQHVRQKLESTVLKHSQLDNDTVLSEELEAYHIEALAMEALYCRSPNKQFLSNPDVMNPSVDQIEFIRQIGNMNNKNPFAASRAVKNLLQSNDLNIVA
jgi:hypothetical protein